MPKVFMNIYGWGSLAIVLIGIGSMVVFPPPSLRADRDGVAHFTAQVEHPETGEGISLNTLIRHYRGD